MRQTIFNTSLPVYVTRQAANGETVSWGLPAWMVMLVMFLVWLSVVAWSVVGLVVIATKFI